MATRIPEKVLNLGLVQYQGKYYKAELKYQPTTDLVEGNEAVEKAKESYKKAIEDLLKAMPLSSNVTIEGALELTHEGLFNSKNEQLMKTNLKTNLLWQRMSASLSMPLFATHSFIFSHIDPSNILNILNKLTNKENEQKLVLDEDEKIILAHFYPNLNINSLTPEEFQLIKQELSKVGKN